MPEWTVCPHCQLKHTRRPDGVCPKCKQPVEAVQAPEAPEASAAPAGAPDVYDGSVPQWGRYQAAQAEAPTAAIPTGARVAGVFLLLNAAALALEKTLLPAVEGPLGSGSSASMVFDGVIGSLLIAGHEKVLTWAKVRAFLGALVLTAIHLVAGNAFMAGLQLAFSIGLLALLLGDAGRVRMGLGATAVGCCLMLEAGGLLGYATGRNPLGRIAIIGQIESEPVTLLEGAKFRYRLTPPNATWYLRKASLVAKENAAVDRWMVRPDRDAHVIVIAEELPGRARIDIERFTNAALAAQKKAAKRFEVVDQSPLATTLQAGRLVHTRSVLKGIEIETYYGLFIQDQFVYQVLAFTTQRNFAAMSDDLRQIVSSFQIG